jgi:hypothetical protein
VEIAGEDDERIVRWDRMVAGRETGRSRRCMQSPMLEQCLRAAGSICE